METTDDRIDMYHSDSFMCLCVFSIDLFVKLLYDEYCIGKPLSHTYRRKLSLPLGIKLGQSLVKNNVIGERSQMSFPSCSKVLFTPGLP